jgi:hypothetical protein
MPGTSDPISGVRGEAIFLFRSANVLYWHIADIPR